MRQNERAPLLYSSPALYRLAMRVLYGRHYDDRYEQVAALIPDGSSVADVCAGDCRLYLDHLASRSIEYVALDNSAALVRAARGRGLQAREFNLWVDEVPAADVVVMQGSLYQFISGAEATVEKLLRAARKTVLIAEPVQNLSSSGNSLLSRLSRALTLPANAPEGYSGDRFDTTTLTELFASFDSFEKAVPIAGGRELMGVFRVG